MIRIRVEAHAPNEGPICDFCSDPKVHASLPCETFIAPNAVLESAGFTAESVGHWGACLECDRLIKADDWKGLLNRSINKFAENHGPLPSGMLGAVREMVRGLHEEFRQHRKMEN